MKAKTHIFHGRLYLEGLKRLRVVGFGLLVIALAVSILVPVTFMISSADLTYDYCDTGWTVPTTMFLWNELCYSTLFFPFVSPIFILVIFSFLFKRRESDLYHSILYTRTCVFLSFTAAAMTWVWGITLLCSTVSGILWTLAPTASFAFADLLRLFCVSVLSSALLCGFMLLAVTLCGNLSTTLLNFCLFVILPRLTLCMFGYTLDQGLPLIQVQYFCNGFFSVSWCLPLGLLPFLDAGVDVTNTAMLVYSAVCAVLLFVAAGFCYARRRSEMAGSSAQSRGMQHLFRCLFTMPFAIVTVAFLLTEELDAALLLVLGTVTLLVYYLYELITTKRFRNLWSATPYLLAVVAGGLIFAGCYGAAYMNVLYREIDVQDVESIEFIHGSAFGFPDESYEKTVLNDLSAEPELISEAIECLKDSQLGIKLGTYHGQNASVVNFKLKNGTTVSRMVATNRFGEFDFLIDARLERLPQNAEIKSIGLYRDGGRYVSVYMHDGAEIAELATVFRNEYEALTKVQQSEVKISLSSSMDHGHDKIIRIDGTTASGEHFSSYYRIVDEMKESHAWIDAYLDSVNKKYEKAETEVIVD